jgi:chromosome segregation ATPase
LGGRLDTLRSILSEISDLAEVRLATSRQALAELDEQELELRNEFLALSTWPLPGPTEIEQRRSSLQVRLDAIVRERRAERVGRWNDLARLAQERRAWIKEYAELTQKMELLRGRPRSGEDYNLPW